MEGLEIEVRVRVNPQCMVSPDPPVFYIQHRLLVLVLAISCKDQPLVRSRVHQLISYMIRIVILHLFDTWPLHDIAITNSVWCMA